MTKRVDASVSLADEKSGKTGPTAKKELTILFPKDGKTGAGKTGTLYICGTPIGNLEDVSLRLTRILGDVELVAAEDTRRTGQLLQHLGLRKPIVSYFQHNEAARSEELLAKMAEGYSVALVSDAGMPLVSDPGYLLISAAIEKGISVVPVPGPTAAVTALVASGIQGERFVFEGFLPRSGADRRARLMELAAESRTIVIYESPHRLSRTMADLAEALGEDRQAVVARELTKMHEEFVRGSLANLAQKYDEERARGEFVIVVAGATQEPSVRFEEVDIQELLKEELQKGVSLRDAARTVAEKTGEARRDVYQLGLTLLGNGGNE